ncbi:MAG: tRNA uridine-5-carboxymethylaminomethyl(34) synthesis enzyme MnmG, partial [Ottowia sp.]|nr:tRNA uridine-5-carboxymethylaminomethyl(34) synthesis enzyme MnmG [Ottowia sp.]
RETERLKSTWVSPRNLGNEDAERVLGKTIEHEYSVFDLLRRPKVSYDKLMTLPGVAPGEPLSDDVVEQVEIAAKYSGYIERQRDEIARHASVEHVVLPEDMDYMAIQALSIEVRQKLQQQRPATLGQASRISGVTPAAVSLLRIYLKKNGLMKGAT